MSSSSSGTPSETETLLPPDSNPDLNNDPDIKDKDRPVLLEQFQRNVRLCKVFLGPALLALLGLEVTHMVMALREGTRWCCGDMRQRFLDIGKGVDIAGVVVSIFMISLYIATVLYPISIRTLTLSPLPKIRYLKLHRTLCLTVFLLSLAMIIGHPLPGIVFTIKTYLSPPSVSTRHANLVYHLRTACLVSVLLAVGCMRRGPKLYFPPPKLGTGFGINKEREEGGATGSSNGVRIKLTPAEEEESDIPVPLSGITIDDDVNIQAEEKSNVFDYHNSSMLNFIFLSYIASLAFRSMKVDSLSQSDLPLLEEKTRNSSIRETAFSSSHKDSQAVQIDKVTSWSVVKTLWHGKGTIVLISFVLETTRNLFSFVQIAAMREIIDSFKAPTGSDKSYAYLMCWGLLFGQSVEALMSAYCCVRENYMLHVPIRMTLASMLFSKILRTTDAKALEAHNVAEGDKDAQGRGRSQVMNLLTIDTGTIASMAIHTWGFANGLITLVIATGMLYSMLGVSAFVGIACIPLMMPLSYINSKLIYRCDKEWARARDARTGALKELLLGIKVIKLNALEPYFIQRIRRLREYEVSWQRWRYTLGTIFNILADQLPLLAIIITFFFHTKILGRTLEPSTAFIVLLMFTSIYGLGTFPQIIQTFLSTKVSLDRISRFLSQPEIDKNRWESASKEIICHDATIAWPSAEMPTETGTLTPKFKLRDITCEIPHAKLTLLCGPLGSGKTLFLRALLGEAVVERGQVLAPRSLPDSTPSEPGASRRWTTAEWINDSVAYAPQQSFIRHGTIRDNVLFGQPMWRERYRDALRQAALEPDLEIFHDGDLTEVGEHGVTLSGGQKARVNLARCLYSPAKTVYLDDILSAVDAHTAQFIVTECLQGHLLRDRTVVLVSHHVGLVLPAAEYVIALDKTGTLEQACPAHEASINTLAALPAPESPIDEQGNPAKALKLQRRQSEPQERDESSGVSRHLFKEEHKAIGRVARNHYSLVLRAAGGFGYWLLFALLYGAHRATTMGRSFWLEIWTDDPNPSRLNYYLGVFALISGLGGLVGSLRWIWLYGVKNVGFYSAGSKKIHEMVLVRVFQAPLQFFETTPHGRILNIFGQDIWRLDSASADNFGRLALLTSIAVVWIKAPIIALVSIVFGIPYFWISGHLNKLRSDIRRLTATASSPLYSLYNETIDGVVMVRAFGQNKLMMRAMKVINNRERLTWLADWTVYNWVRAILRSATSIVITATGFVLVQQDISAAQAGLILHFAMTVSSACQPLYVHETRISAVRQLTGLSTDITMPDHESEEGIIPEKSWPSRGEIKVENLCVRYAPDLPEVLKGVSFHIAPGMRVGLVGATGSGKSTLALSLFRAIEPHAGSMSIDDIDITRVALPELRRRLNMVAQDGMLCSGSLRDALDVTGMKDDHEIYEALRRVHLISDDFSKDVADNNPFADLETYVAIEGANFSQGQRQLLCLARALLKQSKILVMDEATSSVDFEMDARITATIKECFADTTMLVIAHRLATIMQYDRVLVLDQGQIIESGEPLRLMEEPTTTFHGMCMAQGEEEFSSLLSMARSGAAS
ncbi:hypothetical protein I317_03131 [Kwoniella heveanensis CBS 569]|nr:hypothetical protein I317_03131 [Kwoniella heveanensis CBS 569]